MSIRPILFSGPMVRAILEDRKGQTRCVLNPQPEFPLRFSVLHDGVAIFRSHSGLRQDVKASYAPGDMLWVRENFYLTDDGHNEFPVFAADPGAVERHLATIDRLAPRIAESVLASHRKLRPSIHMPRWASRLTLEVTNVRVQRVQDISEEDARAEGVAGNESSEWGCEGLIEDFSGFWDSLNAKPRPRYGKDEAGHRIITHYESFPWSGGEHGDAPRVETHRGKPHFITPNPWVGAYSFTHQKCNVDALLETASLEGAAE